MNKFKKLPDAEFEVMSALWQLNGDATASQILVAIKHGKQWKVQTLISLLNRLIGKGFLSTQKEGKERYYTPLVSLEEYLNFETTSFLKQYHNNSFASFFKAFYNDQKYSDEEIQKMLDLIKNKN